MSSSGEASMDRRLLEAATSGDVPSMKQILALNGPGVLLGTTAQGNTCLHIASIQGHDEFCKNILQLDHSLATALLSAVNKDGETPLLTAVARGRDSLASVLLRCCRDHRLSETILKQERRGCNVLHYAIRRGRRMLALQLIEAEPTLSKAVDGRNESPLFIAAVRNFTEVLQELLEIPDSPDSGAFGFNVLHAAVRSGNRAIAKRIMDTRPWSVRLENGNNYTPMHLATYENKVDVLTLLLEHDPILGYITNTIGCPLLCVAACMGHVDVAREILKQCPDAPYCDANGSTCLHLAVLYGQAVFAEFILGSQHLQHLINMVDNNGETALHLAQRNGLMLLARILGDKEKIINNNPVADEAASVSWPEVETTASNTDGTPMDGRVLEAAVSGHVAEMKHLYVHVPGVLLGTTPLGNTCLHIAAIHGHEAFCREVQALNPSLLAAVNSDGETPLLAAVASGRVSVASVLLRCCRDQQLRDMILKQDKHGCNVLHHAIRNGHRKLALELIEAEPALSHAVNQYGESPMFVAVMRKYEDVFDKLLEIPDSANGGANGNNALHAAVRNGNSDIATKIMKTLPALAREENTTKYATPMHMAVLWGKTDVLRVLLEHDRSLGYIVSTDGGVPLLTSAAFRGHIATARELLKHCPDAPNTETGGKYFTCLHSAVWHQQPEFLDFVLGLPQSGRLINMQNKDGNTALHLAVWKCSPKMVAALLLHPGIDVTVLNNDGNPANWASIDLAKTLNWNEVSMRMMEADPQDATSIFNLHKEAKDKVMDLSRKDIKSLTQTYTGNTSLVAILIATITFAAAFTLPGGYSTDAGNEGLPIMARRIAFKAFLISDTLAMCSSLVVAFICVIAKWEDLEFLLYYRSFTKKLMWFAYMATTTTFATGLYTILAPQLPWMAIAICVLTSLLPILTKLLGEWPILRLRFRLGRTFRSELLGMI